MWEASDWVCSKRLKPLIEVLLPALERTNVDDRYTGRLWNQCSVSPQGAPLKGIVTVTGSGNLAGRWVRLVV